MSLSAIESAPLGLSEPWPSDSSQLYGPSSIPSSSCCTGGNNDSYSGSVTRVSGDCESEHPTAIATKTTRRPNGIP